MKSKKAKKKMTTKRTLSKKTRITFLLIGAMLFLFMGIFSWLDYSGRINLKAQEDQIEQEHIVGSSNTKITIKIFGLTAAGMAGGALVGAGVGSAVPGIGTGIGTFGGGIIGGMIGLVGSLAGS